MASGSLLFGQTTTSATELTLERLTELMDGSQGAVRVEHQLAILKRFDTPHQLRQQIVDDLLAQYSTPPNPRVLASAYAAQGRVHGDRAEFARAVEVLERAAQFARQVSDKEPEILFKILCNQAVYRNVLGQRAPAARLLREAIELSAAEPERFEVAFAYSALAHIAEAAGAIDKALEYFKSGFELATQHDRSEIAAQIGINMIELALSENDLELASELFKHAESWIERSSDVRVRLTLQLRKQDLRCRTGEPAAAAEEIERIIAGLEDPTDRQSLGLLYLSLTSCHLLNHDYPAALSAAKTAATHLESIHRSWSLAQIRLCQALIGQGDTATALKVVEELLADPRLVMVHQIELLILRSNILATEKKFEESLNALNESQRLQSERNTARGQELAQFVREAYADKQRELELTSAQARQAAAEATAELHLSIAQRKTAQAERATLLRNISLLASLLFVGAITLFVYSNAKRRTSVALAQREHELNEQLKKRLSDQAAELQQQVSARQQLELAMERKHRDEALGKLTGGVAHDFNNLLTVILHSVELLRVQGSSTSQSSSTDQNYSTTQSNSDLLTAISQAAESGGSIVSRLMAYTRQQPLEPRPTNITNWLNTNIELLRQAMDKSVEFAQHDYSHAANICIDPAQLTTAIINLIANARDALPPQGGNITLTVRTVELDGSSNQWKDLAAGKYCQIEIRDNGRGMTRDQLQHACEPFFTTKQPGAGTGLGLSSVLGFARQSGGDLQLSSHPSEGTTAWLMIPTTDRSESPRNVAARSVPLTGSQHVLIVEDQDAVRSVLAIGLKAIGYSVAEAQNADEAMHYMQSHGAPEILLSDIRMPGSINGVQLRRWALERYPQLHVVLMSGYRDLAADDEPDLHFLQKPVKLQDLHRALSTVNTGPPPV